MTRCSSSPEQKEGEGRGLEREKDPHEGQMINKVTTAVMKKLADSDPTKILTPDHMNRIKQCLSEVYPVFRPPNHPTYAVMIETAIDELDKEGGSTQESISKFIRERFDCLPLAHESLLGHHLKKLSDSREIVSASKKCDMLPAEKNNSVSRREQVQKYKRRKLARGRRKDSQIEHRKVAEEQVEETEQQRKYGHETREPNQEEQKHEQEDEVNGQQGQRKMQQVAMIVPKQKCIVSEVQVEATEQPREHGQQNQEPSLQEQHRKVIDEHIGLPQEHQDEVIVEKKMVEVTVVVEKQKNSELKYRATEEQVEVTEHQREHEQQSQEPNQEQYTKVVDDQNGCSEQQTEQHDEVNGQQSQTQMQEVAIIIENQNNAIPMYKLTGEHFEVSECQRLHGQQSQERGPQEQHCKVIDNQIGFSDELDELNAQQSKNQMEEVAVTLEKQKSKAAEVTEQQREHRYHNQDLSLEEHHKMVIDSQVGPSDEQKDEVNGEKSKTQIQESSVIVETQSAAEHKYKVTEDQVVVTVQRREAGQQSSQREEYNKMIDYQNRSPEHQSEQSDESNGHQSQKEMQETAVVENQINAEHNNKAAEENFEAQEDEIGEEQCQTKDQQCEVAREQLQIEGIESEIQLLEEKVEIHEKHTEPKQQIEMISEQNEPEEQIESTSKIIDSCNMQELLSKNHEKDAAIVTNSSPSLTCQLLPHHGSSFLSEENCVELLIRTRKLEVNLLANLSSIRERSNKSSQKAELQPIKVSSSLELPMEVFPKHVSLGNRGQQHMPKCKNKSIKTFHDVEWSPQQEIGFLERSLERLTSEAENRGEVSRHIGQRTCLNFEAKNEKEKHLEVQNAEAHESEPNITNSSVDLLQESQESDTELIILEKSHELKHSMRSFGQEKQQQISLFSEVKRPDGEVATNEEQQAENAIRETPVEIELAESEQSCKKQQVKQEQQNQRQLHPQHKKPSESGCGVPKPTKIQKLELEKLPENQIEESPVERGTEAPDQSCQTPHKILGQQQKRQLRPRGKKSHTCSQKEFEHDQQPRERLHEIGMTLDPLPAKLSFQAQENTQEPTQRRQLRPRGERQSISEVSITTSTAESPPTRHQATLLPNLQEAEKPQELKISAEKTGQPQQRRQLRPRVKKLSESGEAPTGSGLGVSLSQSLELSNSGRSQLGKLGERQSKSEVSVTTWMVESPPAKHQLPDLQEAEKPQELKKSAVKGGQTQHQRQLRPRVQEPSESGQSSSGRRAVLSPSQYSELSNSGRSQMQKPGVEDSSQVKNQNKNHFNLRKRCTPEPTTMDGLSEPMEQKLNHQGQQKKLKSRPTTAEVPDELVPSAVAELSVKIEELQRQCHLTLRSHRQGVSQSDPPASMTESSPSQDQCEQPEEKEHCDELQQKLKKPCRPKKNFETTLVNADISKNGASAPRPKAGVLFLPSTDQHPQKQGRGRPCKGKLATVATSDVSLPDHSQKQLEQPEKRRRGRPHKEKMATAASNNVSLPDNFQKQLEQPKNRKRGRPSKFSAESTLSKIKLTSKKQKQEK